MPSVCAVAGCDLQVARRAWCNRHYLRWRRHGDPEAGSALRAAGKYSEREWANADCCMVDGCELQTYTRGWCQAHYMKWYRHGSPTRQLAASPTGYWEHLQIGSPDDCWVWSGRLNEKGYGRCSRGPGRTFSDRAHRRMYEMAFGPVPEGLEVDHLCHVRSCCNPWHLEAVTHEENLRRRDERRRSEQSDVAAISTRGGGPLGREDAGS